MTYVSGEFRKENIFSGILWSVRFCMFSPLLVLHIIICTKHYFFMVLLNYKILLNSIIWIIFVDICKENQSFLAPSTTLKCCKRMHKSSLGTFLEFNFDFLSRVVPVLWVWLEDLREMAKCDDPFEDIWL